MPPRRTHRQTHLLVSYYQYRYEPRRAKKTREAEHLPRQTAERVERAAVAGSGTGATAAGAAAAVPYLASSRSAIAIFCAAAAGDGAEPDGTRFAGCARPRRAGSV